MKVRTIKYHILITAMVLFMAGTVYSQDIDPEISRMTQEVINWAQDQFNKYGSVDQHKLDSMNQRIRDRQAELTAQMAVNPPSDSLPGKVIRVAMLQGNVIRVPDGKVWKIKHVTCQAETGGYSVLVTSVKLKERYLGGEQINMPAFTPEASLLTSDMSVVSYNFEIIESEIK